ncbi:MAG TPA: hypothetical protein VGP47_05005, partial [Parachlamydiaceae bacterium]|nr:hypothetical protein [Parachlamydiaceae bacterium]
MLTINQTNEPNKFANIAEDLEKRALSISKRHQQIADSPRVLRAIRNFFNPESKSLISLASSCQSLLDQVERVATVFSPDLSITLDQNQCCATCLKTAKSVISILSNSQTSKVKVPLDNLMLRVAGLQYRIEAVNGGMDRAAVDPLLTEKLCAAACSWKNNHPLIVKKELTTHEITKLEKSSTYPEFAKVLLGSSSLKEAFFNWSLRDNNDVGLFIEFPATSARIKSAFLASRIGRLGVQAFQNKIEKRENGAESFLEKNVALPFFNGVKTEYISILDESREVELNGGLRLTIHKILDVFAHKNREIGNLEIFKQGIM